MAEKLRNGKLYFIKINCFFSFLIAGIILIPAIFISPALASSEEISIKLNDGEVAYISLPFGPSSNISSIFSSFQATSKNAVYWNADLMRYAFYTSNDFSSFDYLKGYWVKITGASVTLKIKGTAPSSYTINLKKGYNAIGCPFNKSMAVEEALKPLKMFKTGVATDPSAVYYLSLIHI